MQRANLSDPNMLLCKMIARYICFPLQCQGCGTFGQPEKRETAPLGWEDDDRTLRTVASVIWAKETKTISNIGALIQCRSRKDFGLFGHYLT